MTRVRLFLLVLVVGAAVLAFLALRPRTLPLPESGPDPQPVPTAPGPAAAARPKGPIAFAVAAPADDRWVPEPCSRIPGGGLLSLRAFYDSLRSEAPKGTTVVPLFLGDLTNVPGDLGREISAYHWFEVVAKCEPQVVAAGPGELALGADFSRGTLARLPFPLLCANAADATGVAIRRAWAIGDVDGQSVLYVASAAPSLQDRILDAGSDVRLLPVRSAVAGALRDGEAEARRLERTLGVKVLLHHGTVEETAAIVREVPGFTLAFAARGSELPDDEPVVTAGVPIFAPGRGLRFGWVVSVEDGRVVRWGLVRIGIEILSRGSPVAGEILDHANLVRDLMIPDIAGSAPTSRGDRRVADTRGAYVGAQACATCHTEQTGAHAESAHRALPAGFPPDALGRPQCLACHVTGAVRRTGWTGKDDTSDLAGVSCEGCHGPGSDHVTEPKAGWGRFALAQCRTCHTPDRSPGFDAEALWAKWGHAVR